MKDKVIVRKKHLGMGFVNGQVVFLQEEPKAVEEKEVAAVVDDGKKRRRRVKEEGEE